jgi:hypothetical protein
MDKQEIIIYNTDDGKTSVRLLAKDGNVWLNQQLMAELFDTSVPNISMHISDILKDSELDANSVIKDYLTTAADGKNYNVTFYSLDMILAVGKVYERFDQQRKLFESQQADEQDMKELKALEDSIKTAKSAK